MYFKSLVAELIAALLGQRPIMSTTYHLNIKRPFQLLLGMGGWYS